MAENARIEELRKRLEKEPGSRLFAQLAEELRKAGDLEAAIQVCREGLQKHSGYTSARMTLGRALMDTGDLAGGRSEFQAVVKAAPDNILASRLLGECLEGLGDLEGALARYKTTLALAPGDKAVVTRLEEVEGRLKTPPPPPPPPVAAAAPAEEPVAPIPLAAADESFELEAPYAAPPTKVGATAPTETVEESFDLEAPAASVTPPPAVVVPPPPVTAPIPSPAPPPAAQPAPELASSTLAELYFNQGHTAKAIEVYRQLLAREPGNGRAEARLTELIALERHLLAEEQPGGATLPADPRIARRAAIKRTIGRLEQLQAALRRE